MIDEAGEDRRTIVPTLFHIEVSQPDPGWGIEGSGDDTVLSPKYRVHYDGSTVTLPAARINPSSRKWRRRGFSVALWDPQHKLTDYAEDLLGRQWRKGCDLPLVLIPRPDNEYSSYAISVALPRTQGGTIDDRHIGWIRDPHAWHLNKSGFAQLAPYSSWEIACTGHIQGSRKYPSLRLRIPFGVDLTPLVQDFLQRAPAVPSSPVVRLSPDRSAEIIDVVDRFGHEKDVGAITVVLRPDDHLSPRRLEILDSEREIVGAWREGILVLEDERRREQIVTHLRSHGVPVRGETCSTPRNLRGVWRYGALEIRAPRPDREDGYLHLPARERTHGMIARFDEASGMLWLQDEWLRDLVLVYVHRLGLDVIGADQAPWPWRVDETVPLVGAMPTFEHSRVPVLEERLRTAAGDLRWGLMIKRIQGSPTQETGYERAYEAFVEERSEIFPGCSLTDRVVPCRLCGDPTAEFLAPVSTDALAYCQRCLATAREGHREAPRTLASQALGLIGQDEFEGQPLLEEQLAVIHVDPDRPRRADDIDRLVLLRFAVPRGAFPWTLLLLEAGLIEDGMRMARGTIIAARDGHACFSLREKVVDDFLHQHGIEHVREPFYPPGDILNSTGRWRADWELGDGTLVEMWGMPEDPTYAAKMRSKVELARRHGIRLVELTDSSLPHLGTIFADWLTGGTEWKWSPLLIQRRTQASTDAPRATGVSNRTARDDRLGRCEQALELVSEGRTRREIAESLGVSIETVAGLLRDGRFYRNPHSDQTRRSLASEAWKAARGGSTKGQFREQHRLTAKRAQEAWRDGHVLFGADRGEL